MRLSLKFFFTPGVAPITKHEVAAAFYLEHVTYYVTLSGMEKCMEECHLISDVSGGGNRT